MAKVELCDYKIYGLLQSGTEDIRYIGVTKNSITRRLYEHCIDKSKTRKTQWIKSVKKNNASVGVVLLEDNLSSAEVFKKECQYILLFKSLGAKIVNLTKGGENPPSSKGRNLSDLTKNKISEANKLARLGKGTGVSNFKSKSVRQFDKTTKTLLATYPSISIAAKNTNLTKSVISRYLNKERKDGGGFHWEYCPSKEDINIIHKDLILGKKYSTKNVYVGVIKLKDGVQIKSYNSLYEASKHSGTHISNIIKVLKGERKSANGFFWKKC